MSEKRSVSLHGWQVRSVSSALATSVIVEHHYLHRKAPCSTAFGLFDPEESLRGVVIYGVPASVPLVKGVLGAENRHLVGELTRLWCDDNTPKNAESFLIGGSIKMSGFEVLVSYADTSQQHVGTVYQATNWLYTGLSSKHKDWRLKGTNGEKHTRHAWDAYGGLYGALATIPHLMEQVERPRKHRYVYFNASKTRKRTLKKLLKYPVLPYPKALAADK